MEKKTWSEENGEWDYSNKQKKQLRALQMRAEAAEERKKTIEQKKNAAILKKMEEEDECSYVKMEEISDAQTAKSSNPWSWWKWW